LCLILGIFAYFCPSFSFWSVAFLPLGVVEVNWIASTEELVR